MTDTEPDRHLPVIADRYPAVIHPYTGPPYDDVRVLLTGTTDGQPGELFAWWPRRSGPVLALRVPWLLDGTRLPQGRGNWTVATTDGAHTVMRGRGCGCRADSIRTWRPWPDYRLAAAPRAVRV